MGDILGMSLAVAPEPGNVPIRSCSLMTMYESSPISKSVHPMPNLLYSTVEPFSRVLQSGPSSITSPARAEVFERNDAREGSVSLG